MIDILQVELKRIIEKLARSRYAKNACIFTGSTHFRAMKFSAPQTWLPGNQGNPYGNLENEIGRLHGVKS